MKVFVERRMKGYAYADNQVHDMPEDQAELFIEKGFGYKQEENEYPIHKGAGYYELSNGEQVRGKKKAVGAEKELK